MSPTVRAPGGDEQEHLHVARLVLTVGGLLVLLVPRSVNDRESDRAPVGSP